MNWTKVSDALPPDGEAVMVTVVLPSGYKYALSDVRFNRSRQCWEIDKIAGWGSYWLEVETLHMPYLVTHWTPMQAPAND